MASLRSCPRHTDGEARGRRRLAALSLLLLGAVLAGGTAASANGVKREPVTLVSDTGRHIITAEIADTPSAMATGLMFRRSLGADEGMLFIYQRPQNITMWMKNTYISLDMIFADASGRIIRIARDTEPFSTRIIESGGLAKVVLEVPAGTARRLRLKPGDRLEHPSVSQP